MLASAPALGNRTPIIDTVMRDDQIGPKQRLLVHYMLHGLDHDSLCERTRVTETTYTNDAKVEITRKPRVGEPLTLEQAGEVLRIKKRTVRSLSRQPAFERLLAAETAAFRNGARARATRRMVALIDEPGQGKAADRKVQLAASQAVLGEGDGNRSGPTINVGIAITQQPGIVIVRRSREPAPTIEHADPEPADA